MTKYLLKCQHTDGTVWWIFWFGLQGGINDGTAIATPRVDQAKRFNSMTEATIAHYNINAIEDAYGDFLLDANTEIIPIEE